MPARYFTLQHAIHFIAETLIADYNVVEQIHCHNNPHIPLSAPLPVGLFLTGGSRLTDGYGTA